MTTRKIVGYWVAGVASVGGITTALLLLSFDVSAYLAAVAANTGLLGLIGVLYQLFRDEAAHQKVVWLQLHDQSFQVGATSHIANTVFDKHVEFSERYVAEVQRTVDTLVSEGPSPTALTHAGKLQEVRREHATWVTHSMSEKLMAFEHEVRVIGAKAQFVATTTGSEAHAEQRTAALADLETRMTALLPELFNAEFKEDGNSPTQLVQRVRELLGIDKLVAMREQLIARAHKALMSDKL